MILILVLWVGRMQEVIPFNFLNSPPTIDGNLQEECWEEVEKLTNFTEFQPKEGTKPPVKTEVMLGYDEENFYIAFICHENEASKIRAGKTNRDEPSLDDYVGIILYTFGKSEKGYVFMVNPHGVQIDGYQGREIDFSFDTQWEAGAKVLKDKWTVEVAIPFGSIRFPKAKEQHWRINFVRMRPRESNEIYFWAPISLNNPSMLEQCGDLYIKDEITSSQKIITCLPYIVGSYDEITPNTINIEPKFGISGKYHLSSNAIFDFAVNPDYSQIETDEPQIDINTTYALHYPEKRPFFFEGMDLFKHPINIIYTRSINDPITAIKFTTRLKNTSLGYISAYDNHTPWIVPFKEHSFSVKSEENSFSNILRLKQHLLKDSYIGVTGTSRDIKDKYYSRVASIDGNIRFLTNYNVSFQLANSWYKEPNDTSIFSGYPWFTFDNYTSEFDGEEFSGIAYSGEIQRLGRVWSFEIWYDVVSPTFRADNGFIIKNDFKKIRAQTNLDFWVNKGIFEKISPSLKIGREYDYKGIFTDEYIQPNISVTFSRQTRVSFYYNLSSKIFGGKEFKDLETFGGSIGISFSKFFSIEVWGQYGDEINYNAFPPSCGKRTSIGSWVSGKPIPKLGIEFNTQYYWLLENDTTVYDVTGLQNKINYQFTKYLSIRFITQYYSQDKRIEFYPLISFEPNAFTVFYLGSNHTFVESKRGFFKEEERRIFIKFRYLFEL